MTLWLLLIDCCFGGYFGGYSFQVDFFPNLFWSSFSNFNLWFSPHHNVELLRAQQQQRQQNSIVVVWYPVPTLAWLSPLKRTKFACSRKNVSRVYRKTSRGWLAPLLCWWSSSVSSLRPSLAMSSDGERGTSWTGIPGTYVWSHTGITAAGLELGVSA